VDQKYNQSSKTFIRRYQVCVTKVEFLLTVIAGEQIIGIDGLVSHPA